jgi:hypothetical protein
LDGEGSKFKNLGPKPNYPPTLSRGKLYQILKNSTCHSKKKFVIEFTKKI